MFCVFSYYPAGSFVGQRPLLSFRGAEGDVGISRQAVGGFEISDEPDRTGRLPRLLCRLAMTSLWGCCCVFPTSVSFRATMGSVGIRIPTIGGRATPQSGLSCPYGTIHLLLAPTRGAAFLASLFEGGGFCEAKDGGSVLSFRGHSPSHLPDTGK